MRRAVVLVAIVAMLGAACGGDSVSNGTSTEGSSTTTGAGSLVSTPDQGGDDEPAVMWVSSFAGAVARVELAGPTCAVAPTGSSADLVAFGLGRVWVTDCAGQQLLAIDVDTGEVVGRRDIGGCASDLAVGETSVFVAVPETSRVLEIDPASGAILDEIVVEGSPSAIALGSLAIGTFEGSVFYQSSGTEWQHQFEGMIYDLQFYHGLLWVLEVLHQSAESTTSRIWTIDPDGGDPVLFEELPDYLNGILVDDVGVWSNAFAQSEIAYWGVDTPQSGPAPVEARWASADYPTKVRLGGGDAFTTHHELNRVTRIDQAEVDETWGEVRNGSAPSVWDQVATVFYEMESLCGHGFTPTDVVAATAAELGGARTIAGGYPPWDSDPVPEDTTPVRAIFSTCSFSSAGGELSASGTVDGVEAGATVTLSVTGGDGEVVVLGTTATGADGTFEFEPVEPPISLPFTAKLVAGSAMCESPFG